MNADLPNYTLLLAPPAVVCALLKSVEEELEAHLPAEVYRLVIDCEAMNTNPDRIGMADFQEYVEDLHKAAWLWANGETVEESAAKIRKRANLAPTRKGKVKKG